MKKFIGYEYDDVGRIYNFSDGTRYYSVTTALGNTKDTGFLDDWKERVGRERAEAITKVACETGTDMHEVLEYYLKGEELTPPPNKYIQNLANQIIPYIKRRVTRVHQVETILYSDTFKLAGTADAIVTYAGNVSILDFKTAKRQPKNEWIQDYLIQLAIYALMAEELGRSPINHGALLFAYKQVKSRHNEVYGKLERFKVMAKQRMEKFHDTNREIQTRSIF